jgi:integrase/recombinase XerD
MEISDQTTCLDPFFPSFEESLSSRNYKPHTLANYRYLLRRFGRLLETEGIAPSALTPDLAVELGRRLPTTPKSQIKIPKSCQAVCRASDRDRSGDTTSAESGAS